MRILYFVSLFCLALIKPAAAQVEYFQQFFHEKINTSHDPDFPEWKERYLVMDYGYKFTIEDGKTLGLSGRLFLFADGKYQLDYREWNYVSDVSFFPGACRKLSGTWQMQGNNLMLMQVGEVLAEGTRHISGLFHATKFLFHKPIVHQVLKGKELVYGKTESDQSGLSTPFCF